MSLHQQFILAAAVGGLRVGTVVPGKLVRVPVEGDRGGKKSGAYRFFDDGNPAGVWWNWKTGATAVWVARERMSEAEAAEHRDRLRLARREREAEQSKQWRKNAISNAALFGRAQPVTPGDPVTQYLAGRGLENADTWPLRLAPELAYWEDGQLVGAMPAMLAQVRSPSGAVVAIHRTYLDADGHKASVSTPKKLTGTAGPMDGAAIRLGAAQTSPDGRLCLAVAEGIETALAVTAIHGIGCWAAVSAHGMAGFQWPEGIKNLYVMGDNDVSGTGQQAANSLAQRAAARGLVARVHIPPTTGQDWADVWAALKRATA